MVSSSLRTTAASAPLTRLTVITRASRTAVQALNALCMLSRSFEIIYLSLNEEHFIYHMCTDRHTVS